MSSFFTLPTSQRRRKRPRTNETSSNKRTSSKPASKKQKPAKDDDDDSIASDSASDAGSAAHSDNASDTTSDSDAGVTAASRRLKLAEQYLSNIRSEVRTTGDADEEDPTAFDAADVDRELIAVRLKEDVEEEKGKLHRYIALKLDLGEARNCFFRADTLATTGAACCGNAVYTCSKDMRVCKWELPEPGYTKAGREMQAQRQEKINGSGNKTPKPERRKPKLLLYTAGDRKKKNDTSYQHHTAPILCIAASSSGKFVATGGADRKLIIWDAETLSPLKVFSQHRDSVTSLAFRGKTNQLFSASKDRTVKIWSLDTLAYVETLFGHQDEVVDVAAVGGTQERCVSVGARDRTARFWKVVEESQLVFRGGGTPGSAARRKDGASQAKERELKPVLTNEINGHDHSSEKPLESPTFNEGSLDRILQIDTQLFVTGSDSGALSLYSLHKKKPLHVYPAAHGWDPAPAAGESSADVDVESSNPNIDGDAEVMTNGDAHLTNGTTSHLQQQQIEHINNPHANAFNAQPTPRWITALKGIPYSDLFVSGSWDGYVRVWRVTGGSDKAAPDGEGGNSQRRIESVGVLGDVKASESRDGDDDDEQMDEDEDKEPSPIKAVINDLSIFARGTRGDEGVCVVAALGTETRLGRWKKLKGGGRKGNGMCIWEVLFA